MRNARLFAIVLGVTALLATAVSAADWTGTWQNTSYYVSGSGIPQLAGAYTLTIKSDQSYVLKTRLGIDVEGTYEIKDGQMTMTTEQGKESLANLKGDKLIVTKEDSDLQIVYERAPRE